MIISRTPFRMSYVGGGSDLPTFYREETGAVLSTAIDKFMYVTLHEKFDSGVRVAYSKTEEVKSSSDVEHPIVRASLEALDISGGVEITSTADIPAKGTGLGSSSSYTVGLLAALHAFKKQSYTPEDLASQACHIEIDVCREPIGKQDQFAAAIGGLKLYEFHPDESVTVNMVNCEARFQALLDACTLIFYTGQTRAAKSILQKQKIETAQPAKKRILRRMVALSYEFKDGIESRSLEHLGELLRENWALKTQLTVGISNSGIDAMYDIGIENGALGGKLLGAGAGGFMMFLVKPENQHKVVTALSKYRHFNFRIENTGSRIIYAGG